MQAWGMTETSPVASVARPPAGLPAEAAWDYRVDGRPGAVRCRGADRRRLRRGAAARRQGGRRGRGARPVDHRVVLQGRRPGEVPRRLAAHRRRRHDRPDRVPSRSPTGPRTSSSPAASGSPRSTWRTRSWRTPTSLEAAVVGVPDEKWQERPLAIVVRREGRRPTHAELRAWLGERVAKWQLPERWAFIDEVPKTSVGKFDKKVLRKQYADGALDGRDGGVR